MDTYTPSLDWAHEVFPSLLWVAKAWTITAAITVIVLILLAKSTVWGRQYWRITRAYFTGRDAVRVWAWLAILLLSTTISVRLNVLLSYQGNDLMDSLQMAFTARGQGDETARQAAQSGFWNSLMVFGVLAALYISRIMADLYLTQHFIMRWRTWLTNRLTGEWLSDRAYYRARFTDTKTDNPDQRIQTDIDIFTAGIGGLPNQPQVMTSSTLLFGAIESVSTVVSFVPILWKLSGPLTVAGITLNHALFWVAFVYVFFATVVAFWIGRPLIQLSFRNESTNAAFRYALIRLRDAAEAVGFYRGEDAERSLLRSRFGAIMNNYRAYVRRTIGLTGWNLSLSQLLSPLPLIVQAQRLFKGEITFGDVTQSSAAFGQISDSLSFFRNAYDQFAAYRAAIIRLHGLVESNEHAVSMPSVETVASADGSVQLTNIEVRTPAGEQLVDPLSLRLFKGDTLVVTGRSGAGKTTLLRSLAQMWPFAGGTISRPVDGHETMFLSQMPYVPLGDLRTVVSYPSECFDISDEVLQHTLTRVALSHLTSRLSEEADWAKVLSPGEQQRVAFARVLLTRPKVVFLDEATSALDEGLECALYDLVRAEMPDTILVSVSHRPSVDKYHQQRLELLGEGRWRLGSATGSQPASG